jgi:DNA helicase-2/ATP-dependent DNA helicase PcrA
MHSNILIKNNLKRIDKEIKPMRAKGVPIKLLSLPDEKAEGEIIIREIEEKMGGTSHYQFYAREISSCPEDKRSFQCSYKFSDFAVIYRTNAQAKAIEEAFNTSGIPYQVIGEKYLLRKKEIINFLSLLKVIISPVNDLNLHRAIVMIPEDLDKVLLHRLKELKDKLPAVEFLKVACEETDFKKYCGEENFALLKGIAAQYGDMKPPEAISRCINEISLLTPADTFNPKADSVMLMTLHMAKGLEFKVVFIAGVEDGLIPYTMKKEDVNIEEERRLFYVGMTRAMDEVLLLCARNRFLYGQRLSQSPSPFLSEILEEFKEHGFVPEKIKKMHKSDQMGLF